MRPSPNPARAQKGLYDFPRPGDFAVINTGTSTTGLITGLEKLDDLVEHRPLDYSDFDHAVVCTAPGERKADGTWLKVPAIVEAEPHGAVLRGWHYENRPHMWSAGLITLTASQRMDIAVSAAHKADAHVGYGWLDYGALVAHALHLPVPGLRGFIKRSDRLICSQLVDVCYQEAGVELFDDKRWNGYVKPSDLGILLNKLRRQYFLS